MRLIGVLVAIFVLSVAQPAIAEEPALSVSPRSDGDAGWRYTLVAQDAYDAQAAVGRDWKGLGTDVGLFLGYQVAVAGLVYLSPGDVTGASDSEKDELFDTWWRHVRNPVWDADPWWVNYVGHPYWGAAYYVRARERGFRAIGAFVYAMALSTAFEFGVESFAEPASYQDLIVTPVAGALLGAFLFEPIRAKVKAKAEWRWYDHSIMIATDPLGALNAAIAWAFRVKPDFQLQFRPFAPPGRTRHEAAPMPRPRIGLEVILRY